LINAAPSVTKERRERNDENEKGDENDAGKRTTYLSSSHRLQADLSKSVHSLLQQRPRASMETLSRLGVFESDEEKGEVGLGRRAAVRVEVDAGDEVAVAVCEVGD
jgi:hypothetical protein